MSIVCDKGLLLQHITLQALQGLQPGTSGHLLLKTENGQYQLLRVGAAPTTPAAAAITPTGSPATATTGMPTTTYRLQSVPVSAANRPNATMQQVSSSNDLCSYQGMPLVL